jgi:ankyrin repeat protein
LQKALRQQLLVNAGADVISTSPHLNLKGETEMYSALSMACAQTCCCKSLQLLLEHGADPTQRFVDDNATVLHQAAGVGQISHSTLLLAADSDQLLHVVDIERRAALFLAVNGEQLQLVQLLIERGAAVNTGDVTGIRPLHLAVKSTVIAAYLLEQCADPHAADHNDCTPLYYIAFAGRPQW